MGAGVALAGSIWNVQESCGRCGWKGSLRPTWVQSAKVAQMKGLLYILVYSFIHSTKMYCAQNLCQESFPWVLGAQVERATLALRRLASLPRSGTGAPWGGGGRCLVQGEGGALSRAQQSEGSFEGERP